MMLLHSVGTHMVKRGKLVKKALQTLHYDTWPVLNTIIANMEGADVEVDVLLDEGFRNEVAENRKKLASIVNTIILLGRLGLSYRGHRDDHYWRVFARWCWQFCGDFEL